MRNKLRVTSLFGAGADQGLMDPKVNMKVRHGIDDRWIVSATESGFLFNDDLINLSQTSGGSIVGQAYPHECYILYATASGFGWPNNSTDVVFGHYGENAFFKAPNTVAGTGMVYEDGGGNEVSFSRLNNPS